MAEKFSSVEHLSAEAVAAFVDNEMPPRARHRAQVHMVHCEECRRDVLAQRAAAQRMREFAHEHVHTPSALMSRLTAIPSECPEEYRKERSSLRKVIRGMAFSTYRGLEQTAARVTDAIGERADAVGNAVREYRHELAAQRDSHQPKQRAQ